MVFLIFLFIWSVVRWAQVIVLLICGALVLMCQACGEGGGGDPGSCCGCDGGAGAGDFSGAATGGVSGAGAGVGACGADTAMFYYAGPFPYAPWWGGYYAWDAGYGYGSGSGYTRGRAGGSCRDDSCNCVVCCKPLGWLCFVFPVLPENAWGGLAGKLMGTHAYTWRGWTYRGNSKLIDFLGKRWRRPTTDLHENTEWRARVRNFLAPNEDPAERGRGRRFSSDSTEAFEHRNVDPGGQSQRTSS